MTIKALLVEDETLAADKIKRQIDGITPRVEIVGWTKSVRETVQFLNNQEVDLILLDIQLEDGLSFQLFDQMDIHTPIIFTTAFDEYALKAFRVNSVDYLLKPFTRSELQQAVEKYQRYQKSNVQPPDYQALASMFREQLQPEWRDRFLVTVGEHIRTVAVEEIAYFFADQKYVFLVRKDGSQHIVDFTLDLLEEELNPRSFFRINRKYLISLAAIRSMVQWTKGRIKVELSPPPSEETIVSVGRSPDFRNWLGK